MASSPVQPLRIHKGGTPVASPLRAQGPPRPLSDISPTEHRRNSPSFKQNTKRMSVKDGSSPFQPSPFNSENNPSPRLFWQGRDPATPNRFLTSDNAIFPPPLRESSPSPTRKASMERLQRASRVKNSNMFAREQKRDAEQKEHLPLERPLANLKEDTYTTPVLPTLRSNAGASWSQVRGQDSGKRLQASPPHPIITDLTSSNHTLGQTRRPSKDQISPTKSALSQRFYSPRDDIDSEDEFADEPQLPEGRTLRGHVKSVTFDAAPPQVNEYELTTPDISSIGTNSRDNSYDSEEEMDEEDGYYYDREDSGEHDDSFDDSLEDTDKTPVVGPEDWRYTSPDDHDEESFLGPEGSPMPDALPLLGARPASRIESDSDSRPLPPLPGFLNSDSRRNSSGQLGAAERATTSQRGLPQPPVPASASKSEIQALSLSKMTLEERLQLMMIGDKPKTPAEEQRERRMRRAVPKTSSVTPEPEFNETMLQQNNAHSEDEDTLDDLGDYQLPPRPTRESILRKVSDQEVHDETFNDSFISPAIDRLAHLDPDIAIPSTEEDSLVMASRDEDKIIDNQLTIMKEENGGKQDLYSIPQYPGNSDLGTLNEATTLLRMEPQSDAVSESHYSSHSDSTPTNQTPEPINAYSGEEDNLPATPRASSPIHRAPSLSLPDDIAKSVSLPDFGGFMDKLDFGLGLEDYMTTSPALQSAPRATTLEPQALRATERATAPEALPAVPVIPAQQIHAASRPNYDGSDWGPEDSEDDDGYESSESVIRHRQSFESLAYEPPTIAEHEATIKGASGSKLKTRPSATPTDLMAMRDARRQVSGEEHSIPPIPDRHRSRPSTSDTVDGEHLEADYHSEDEITQRKVSFKRSLTLDLDMDMGLGLDQDFDRVIDKQKRGYLLRKNTKLVVASSDGDLSQRVTQSDSKSLNSSPTKTERPQSWVVEPWNGRRKSYRVDSSGARKRDSGAVPPLPGQESNARGLEPLTEGVVSSTSELITETSERGRLFVKVVGVKDLDLPLPRHEKSWFNLTLDNGVHCVTTAWLELARNAPIGQEFELVVPDDLEFQLTLGVKLERPIPKRMIESPTKSVKTQKSSTFSRVFTSPKKRRLMEQALREEEQKEIERQRIEAADLRARNQPTTWDLLSPLAAEDGSFGRSYVCLKDHEAHCYGRPYVVDVAAFNEWAAEDANTASSVKSKRGMPQTPRRAPYRVGKLELQLLFVPKPKGVKDDDLPKSMNACIRQMKEAESAMARSFEGHLSQQGGDCPYWRRRFFRLSGPKLTAYHESTGQPRATINLANASKLIDDRRSLTQPTSPTKSGGRRKSGFAEDEDGYMFIEEGFRVRFANGEVIDFYADNREAKEAWMQVLDQAVGKADGPDGKAGKWCEMVLKKEEKVMKLKQSRKSSGTSNGGRGSHSRTKSMIV